MTMSPGAQKLADEMRTKVSVSKDVGHNTDASGDVKSYADRLVRLLEEADTVREDIRELKAEAKDKGIDPKALAIVAKRRSESAEARHKREALEDKIDEYSRVFGFLD